MTDHTDLTNPQGITWKYQPQEWQDALEALIKAGGLVEYLTHSGEWCIDYCFNPEKHPGYAYRAVLPPVTYDPDAVAALVKAAELAAEHLAKIHDDAFLQAGGLCLVRSDGKAFSVMQINRCQEVSKATFAALARIKGDAK